MSCSPFDLRDYLLDELAEGERRLTEQHVGTCAGCRDELARLGATRTALLSAADEEIPRRIGFVSDQVFEPSRLRRWWQAFWGSPARLGFASAAMISAALVVSAFTKPAPAPSPVPSATPATVDLARLEAQFDQRLSEAVKKAVTEAESRQERRTAGLLAAAEARHDLELKSIQLAVEQEFSIFQKRFNQVRMVLASNDFGAPR